MLLIALSTCAADDLFLNTRWRGLWLTEQIQAIITSEAMADPAVSLAMLRLYTQLALDGSDDREVVSFRENFNAHVAALAPQSWFVALGQTLLSVAMGADTKKKERQAALDQLGRLAKQLPGCVELSRLRAEALRKLHQ